MTQVLADHHDAAVTPDHFALLADRLDARINLHVTLSFACDHRRERSVLTDLLQSTGTAKSCPQLGFPTRRDPGSLWVLLVSVNDAAASQVVGGKLHHHAVVRQDPDVVLPHLAADVGEYLVAVLQLNAEHRIGQGFDNAALHLDGAFFGHSLHDSGVLTTPELLCSITVMTRT